MECRGEEATVSSVRITAVVVERARGVEFGVVNGFHYLDGQCCSSSCFSHCLPAEDARRVRQIASAFRFILSIRETKSRLFLSKNMASSAQKLSSYSSTMAFRIC